MNEQLVQRVKNSLNKQFYSMNHGWLVDCVEYYMEDNINPTQDDIITFVKNQWQLCDLREINNENGSLPRNLKNTKCTKLTGGYILQMDKIYDISVSKYKQLEKIRNVSSENVDATENENTNLQDKFQPWEPKSKRMLQLFLTDGVQEILAIEYKPIRLLSDKLFPGYKLLIKGPVDCRKGVILLEEKNIQEVGGEVENLLIINAVENVFARSLNLKENPDPYNDNNKQIKNETKSQLKDLLEDDFDFDSQSLAQIDSVVQQNFDHKKNSTAQIIKQETSSINSKSQGQNTGTFKKSVHNRFQCDERETSKKAALLSDDDDLFLELVDEKAFLGSSSKNVINYNLKTSDQPSTSQKIQSQLKDDFPTEDELNEFVVENSPNFRNFNSRNQSNDYSKAPSINKVIHKNQEIKYKNTSSNTKDSPKKNQSLKNSVFKFPSPSKSKNNFQLSDVKLKTSLQESPKKSDNKNSLFKSPLKYKSTLSNRESPKKSDSNKYVSTVKKSPIKYEKLFENPFDDDFPETQFGDEFNENFEFRMEVEPHSHNMKEKSDFSTNLGPSKSDKTSEAFDHGGVKRLASIRSPSIGIDNPSKKSCTHSTPIKSGKNEGQITNHTSKELKLGEETTIISDFLCNVKEQSFPDEAIQTLVRGKVTHVEKLQLLKKKEDNQPYFYLKASITDDTGNLDVVFSSEVLEKIIGYTTSEFSAKRKLAKATPEIKEELRNGLTKAEKILRHLDVLMKLELKKNEIPLILSTIKLTDAHKKVFDEKSKQLGFSKKK